MNQFIDWLCHVCSPKVKKFTDNRWIQMLSTSLSAVLPVIMIGSVVSIYNVFAGYLKWLPSLSPIYDYSFGMISLLIAALIGYYGMEKLKHPSYKIGAAMVSLCVFMMMIRPEVENFVASIRFARFGGSGMIPAFFAGLLSVVVIHNYTKLHLFEESNIPDFLINWLNIIIPGFLTLLMTQIIIVNLNLDLFQIITDLFSPIAAFAQTFPGFILICMLPAILYSMGINSWFFNPITTPVSLAGIEANIAAVAAGGVAMNVVTAEVMYSVLWVGGMGCTLSLNVLLARSRANKLKNIGTITLVPSIFNINEPLVFAAPIAMNPLLMFPMWINSFLAPVIVWVFMKSGFVSIPSQMMRLGQLPMPIASYLVTKDGKVVLLWITLLVVSGLVWYPFFKAYEKNCLAEETAGEEVV